MKELKVVFEEADWSPEEVQRRVDEAFDILFEELFMEMKQKNVRVQKQKQKGGGNYGRLGKSRDESYLGL
ncbi:MAG: hypothetical protein ACD_38C00169G0020 [uncultured bacterium]|uniref:Uncharacterized protein n=1 Tax=Candidatus Daviesbacteria bacterium GW2011_GWC2_40_12 TaxID=1618431 RepID=A0A0G0QN86_9BACT|nr:MAG: hypothetical protein ACD_38C00169G0020 [uncultured bacterium]KKR15756.1 MAG: hypothetical protein UT45_C0014G0014 [Candidatus Daviesbacteria bacterium GW2011_GWA2_39_33]KKR25256.1 MAG: hypothetical protein UT54_C0005G0016 [Candidatus Daviesbacteria bacterium GW2011_GWB1_39_5]KKR41899.1 MAG: hypothetical protein UT77_C0005G0014 [Candidatus Daviesbacteria bacterium GW2011_GWC2_40_12]OGE21177.1 MAG: hypothetical protein A2778_02515 [Candidatus Daviesbacteria bacterium RIFCSPHIGHO2_01_FULL_